MRHLVGCCAGTWQGLVADSNGCGLLKAFVPRAGDPQAHYVAGAVSLTVTRTG